MESIEILYQRKLIKILITAESYENPSKRIPNPGVGGSNPLGHAKSPKNSVMVTKY